MKKQVGRLLRRRGDLKDEMYDLVIERKTWEDLRASIRDSRFREQRSRLLEWKSQSERHQIMYMIEGKYHDEFKNEKTTCYRLQIGYSVPVLFVDSKEELQELIAGWAKLETLEKLFRKRNFEEDQVESRVQQTKKRNYDDSKLFFMGTLCQMKGVSVCKQGFSKSASIVF